MSSKSKQEFFAQLGIKSELILILEGHGGIGSIYLSNFVTAMQESLLQKNQIKSVLTVAKSCSVQHEASVVWNFLYVPVQDKKDFDIRQYFGKCFAFIEKCREKSNVLVHCRAGVSRSATIIIAYLMQKFYFNLHEAYQLVKRANPKTKPNIGFITQLILYNRQLNFPQLTYDALANEFSQQCPPSMEKESHYKTVSKDVKKLEKDQEKIKMRIRKIQGMIAQSSCKESNMSEHLREKLRKFRRQIQVQCPS